MVEFETSRWKMVSGEKFFVAIGGKAIPDHLRGVEGALYHGEWRHPDEMALPSVSKPGLSKRAIRRLRGKS